MFATIDEMAAFINNPDVLASQIEQFKVNKDMLSVGYWRRRILKKAESLITQKE